MPLEDCPNIINIDIPSGTQLSKKLAESMFCLVLPLAERNLYVALKQERFAGRDLDAVKHLIKRNIKCLQEMHSKGVLHADLKSLNIMRIDGRWLLIDLDAICVIGMDSIGNKSSSAYAPPEAIYVTVDLSLAVVRSKEARKLYGESCEVLIADPSFDVWALGCLLYQLVNKEVLPLFQCGQDDNLSSDKSRPDNLFILAEWPDHVKNQKLSQIDDTLARNLVALMLMKDPLKRPGWDRILAHPFLSGAKVRRLPGQQAAFDVFVSYRVSSDKENASFIYEELTKRGVKVWWDAKCLQDGENWEEGFCRGLVNSAVFVPILSKKALANFETLTKTSKCDNVLLEYRLALELHEMGLIENIFPIVVGEPISSHTQASPNYNFYVLDRKTVYPNAPDVHVTAVEEALKLHLSSQALGTPMQPNRTVSSVLKGITKMQGASIGNGLWEEKMLSAVSRIEKLCQDIVLKQMNSNATVEPTNSGLYFCKKCGSVP